MSSINSSGPSPVPFVYRTLFTYIDPLFCILGLYTHLFAPEQTSTGYGVTSITGTVAVGTQHMLDNLAAFFALLFVVEGVLLRVRSHDATVWRIVQAGGFLLDLIMVVGAVRQLTAEGRLDDFSKYTGDDWHHVFGNAGFGVFRLSCALGIGFGSSGTKGKRA